jgi:hypothetical protein
METFADLDDGGAIAIPLATSGSPLLRRASFAGEQMRSFAHGTRVVFAEAWDIFPECVVPEGTTATITENGLNELACACIVTPDDPNLRTALAEWDGDIWLTPPLDRSVYLPRCVSKKSAISSNASFVSGAVGSNKYWACD